MIPSGLFVLGFLIYINYQKLEMDRIQKYVKCLESSETLPEGLVVAFCNEILTPKQLGTARKEVIKESDQEKIKAFKWRQGCLKKLSEKDCSFIDWELTKAFKLGPGDGFISEDEYLQLKEKYKMQ